MGKSIAWDLSYVIGTLILGMDNSGVHVGRIRSSSLVHAFRGTPKPFRMKIINLPASWFIFFTASMAIIQLLQASLSLATIVIHFQLKLASSYRPLYYITESSGSVSFIITSLNNVLQASLSLATIVWSLPHHKGLCTTLLNLQVVSASSLLRWQNVFDATPPLRFIFFLLL